MIIATWAIAAVVVLVFELIAVRNRQPGDTITEVVKSNVVTHTAMGALIVWALWHFLQDEGGPIDLVFVVVGAGLGFMAYRKRTHGLQRG